MYGVSQGIFVGSNLFLLHKNDLSKTKAFKTFLFADGASLFLSAPDPFTLFLIALATQ